MIFVSVAVKFCDPLDAEALLEFHPDIGTQTVAGDAPQRIVGVIGPHWLVQQISAQFADIDETGCTVFAHFVQQATRRELPPDHH
jgi:hypothetical protein